MTLVKPQTLDQLKSSLPATTVKAMNYLRRELPRYVIEPSLGMPYGDIIQQNKYVAWTFPLRRFPDGIEMLHMTDLQYGHKECQVDRIVEYIKWVLSEPNRFVDFGGDMVDAATIFSPGQPWENTCEPQGEIFKFCELLAPLRPRILGYVGGNHERRTVKTFGDAGLLIATLLGIPYSNGRQLIDVTYGAHEHHMTDLWHGKGASATDGAKVQMVSNYVKNHPGADLYLTGHLHDCFVFQKFRERYLYAQRNVKIKKYYFGMSSSFLNTWGTYAEVAGMSITDVAMLKATLEPNGHWMVTIR